MNMFGKMSTKRIILGLLSVGLMAASWLVDGSISEEDMREVAREEIAKSKEGSEG